MSKITPQNPLGLLAIDHLEFTCNSLQSPTRRLFYSLGLYKTFENKPKNTELFTQGQIRFVLCADREENAPSRIYFNKHGEGVSKISFLVEDAEHAFTEVKKRGGKILSDLLVENSSHGAYKIFSIAGVGDVTNEFVQRPMEYFRPDFVQVDIDKNANPLPSRLARIDHLTNNVPRGEMEKWVEFYQRIYGFKTTRYFDIRGKKTGLESKVVQLEDGSIIIPINWPRENDSKSQIQEFLDLHKGAGVQHIAMSTPHIIDTVATLQERGIQFLSIPPTYYEDIPNRGFSIQEDIGILQKRQLLVDGDEQGYLIQNFTNTYIGPLFFEIIQRKNHFGFGEGNFQALFDAIERDQMERGHL